MDAPGLAFETWGSTNLNPARLSLSTAFMLHRGADKAPNFLRRCQSFRATFTKKQKLAYFAVRASWSREFMKARVPPCDRKFGSFTAGLSVSP